MNVEKMRNAILSKDETNGYIERERAIDTFLCAHEIFPDQAEKYVTALEEVLSALSAPIDPDDILVGRMVEGPIPYEMESVPAGGKSHVNNPFRCTGRNAGHMSLDYRPLLTKGLSGIAAHFSANASTPAQQRYAQLMQRAVTAIASFAARYADAAEASGNLRAAKALRVVPLQAPYDFFSAMQSVWFVELVLSCVVGARDFGYSRLDLALLPYFDNDHADDALEILTSFVLLNNNIGGMGSELHVHMPVPCAATNIYLMLGGKGADDALALDLLFLKAAEAVKLPQPVLALRQCKDSAQEWKNACAHAAQVLNGQVSLYNDDALIPNLVKLGFSEEAALNYTMSGCNRAETCGHQSSDAFDNCVSWFLEAFYDRNVHTPDELIAAMGKVAERELKSAVGNPRFDQNTDLHFNLESMLLTGCADKCCDLENGGLAMETYVHNLCGIATIADSLAAIEAMVFEEQRVTLNELRAIVGENFENHAALLLRIKNKYPKYGNDDERADKWARKAGEALANAAIARSDDRIHIPSFYSLYFHHNHGRIIGATPDGRLAGTPVSENQSPTYGCDVNGPTAVLHSAAALPQHLCGAGGLNLRLSRALPPEQLAGLVSAYFAMGGVNIAPNVLNKETLLAAREHPDQYRNLAVRIVGYSEIYLRLPEHMQLEILERTELSL